MTCTASVCKSKIIEIQQITQTQKIKEFKFMTVAQVCVQNKLMFCLNGPEKEVQCFFGQKCGGSPFLQRLSKHSELQPRSDE